MKTIDINSILDDDLSEGRNNFNAYERGKQCFVLNNGYVKNLIRQMYGREDGALKIFFEPLEGDIKDYYWGSSWRKLSVERTEEIGYISKLWEATVFQNLCWIGGYAPRVYDLVKVEFNGEVYPAQVIQYIEGKEDVKDRKEYIEDLKKYLEEFGCLTVHKELVRSYDFIDGKLIDFQGFRFGDDYEDKIKKFVHDKGRYGDGHYQSVEELGLNPHPRNTKKRIEYMKFEDIEWQSKRVLDIGCNSGVFCNYASENGAKRVLGVDLEDNVLAAKVLAIYLGNFNIDYMAMDVKNEELKEKFDIVLFLSMNIHVGFHKWMADITDELMVFEENAKGSKFKPEYWKEELGKYFESVEVIGYGKDHGSKPIFWCKK